MKAYSSNLFSLPLPVGHRFPMEKYRLLHDEVAAHAIAWGIELIEAPQVSEQALRATHAGGYVDRMLTGVAVEADMRRIGFPWSQALIERSRRSAGATLAALRIAIARDRVAVNLAGGTHHAAEDRGGGYCVFNDSVIAIRSLRAEGLLQRALVIDLDVHQGDGTAHLCAKDPLTYTFSMHAARNYPALKPPSDLDIALPDGTGDARYLDTLAAALPRVLDESAANAIVYLAGADPYAGDRLGYLRLSKPGLLERDRMVLQAAANAGIPVAVCMAGGYAESVEDIVDIHAATVRLAAEFAHHVPTVAAGV